MLGDAIARYCEKLVDSTTKSYLFDQTGVMKKSKASYFILQNTLLSYSYFFQPKRNK